MDDSELTVEYAVTHAFWLLRLSPRVRDEELKRLRHDNPPLGALVAAVLEQHAAGVDR